jgi:hypothetical protein
MQGEKTQIKMKPIRKLKNGTAKENNPEQQEEEIKLAAFIWLHCFKSAAC